MTSMAQPARSDGPLASEPRCRVCGGTDVAETVRLREMMFATREGFDYHRCATCGSMSIATIPADLGAYYPSAYYPTTISPSVAQDAWWRRPIIRGQVGARMFHQRPFLPGAVARRLARVPRQLRDVAPIIEGGLTSFDDSILDVGCTARPVRLAKLRRLGFRNLLGVEPFVAADTTFQGVPVRRGYLSDIDGRHRLIMFHHSLEHVSDPIETLRQARERLEPDGRCLVRTPIADGWFWREYGPDWVELDAPRHIVVFSLAGIELLAAKVGLEVVAVVWETQPREFIASEQYRRDIAMYEPGSWFVDPSSAGFDEQDLDRFKASARERNASGDAGRAAIWLRPA